MKTLAQLLTPKSSVFDSAKRDTVLDLKDLQGNRIDPRVFFAENFVTEGMRDLLTQTFKRLEGKSDQGVFLLKQAMGGGKTHNLLTLGLLAKHPEIRAQVMSGLYKSDSSLGAVKVVNFSGRENAPLGIWGAIADQLGKRDFFRDYYSPLIAPGQTAWENLFDGDTVLILLDEMPPYFDNAFSIAVGNSNLARVTATALSNLLVALGSEKCARVALVMTDLTAAYAQGQAVIQQVLNDFHNETQRLAKPIIPVRMNSDELYNILRVRLFEHQPDQSAIDEVAQGYAAAVRAAGQMGLVNETPESYAVQIKESFPFHPALRDLYARFKENEGFQQTRGLIRLMRTVVSTMWKSGLHERTALIAPYDLDLNDQDTVTTISGINSSLTNAVAHDIASEGNAVAERLDHDLKTTDGTDAAKLLLMSSLSTAMNQVRGLSIPEIILILCRPGRDTKSLKSGVLEKLAAEAWYLHANNDGKLYFQNVQNLNARLNDLVKGFLPEQAVKMIRDRLEEMFKPKTRDCYQRLVVLPAVNEIELDQGDVTLVISEPYSGGLNPAIKQFFEQTTLQNRVMFLTGLKSTYSSLIEAGKRLRAIETILSELEAENVAKQDMRMIRALELRDKINTNFYQAVRDTFTVLYYPQKAPNIGASLLSGDFLMQFTGNSYVGETQVREVLKEKYKFNDDVSSANFRKMVEKLLFTAQVTTWSEIRRRAATNVDWPWHLPRALDDLKSECLSRDYWREEGGYLDKGPFPAPKTALEVNVISRNDDTGEAVLKVIPSYADAVYYEFGGTATTASNRLPGYMLTTNELEVSFLAVDSKGEHETGEAKLWRNSITLRQRIYTKGDKQWLELKAIPTGEILYTTDGSSPQAAGATYAGDFELPEGTKFVLAVAKARNIQSEVRRIDIQSAGKWALDVTRPATWNRKQSFGATKESYEFLERMKKYKVLACGVVVNLTGSTQDWIELSISESRKLSAEQIEKALEGIRAINPEANVSIDVQQLDFTQGQDLQDWAAEIKTTVNEKEVKQNHAAQSASK
ncbi:MAG: DUF499 domain-containing protein [Meiothermus sp.]|nr:DUF499 domain-containing protein [Meiothermus sp.]